MKAIDADKLKQDVLDWEDCPNGFSDVYDKARIIDAIDEQPTIEAEPIKHGKWIWVEDVPLEEGQTEYDRESFYQCSECDAYDLRLKDCHADYCWSCGAKMDLDEVNK